MVLNMAIKQYIRTNYREIKEMDTEDAVSKVYEQVEHMDGASREKVKETLERMI